MRKTIAAVSIAGALLLGGTALAAAEVGSGPSPASTSQADDYGSNSSDTTWMWGLAGLLGLLGLLGLRHRHEEGAKRTGGTVSHNPGGTGPLTATTTSATPKGASGIDTTNPGGAPGH